MSRSVDSKPWTPERILQNAGPPFDRTEFFYVRDPKTRAPVATFCVGHNAAEGLWAVGIAVVHPKEAPCYATGRLIAERRARRLAHRFPAAFACTQRWVDLAGIMVHQLYLIAKPFAQETTEAAILEFVEGLGKRAEAR